MKSRLSQLPADERRIVIVSYIVAALMLACVSVSFLQIFELFIREFSGDYLMPVSFLIAFEALYSRRYLKNLYFTDPSWIGYRLAEIILIVLLVKLGSLVAGGNETVSLGIGRDDISIWLESLWNRFFNLEFQLGFMVAALVWGLANLFGSELVDLESDEKTLSQEIESGEYVSRYQVRGRLVNLIFLVGAMMVIITTVLRLDQVSAWRNVPSIQVGVRAIFLYFFLGLVLLSITQLNLLRARWRRDRLKISSEIEFRWIFYSALFIFFLTLIAAILPTEYSLDILSTLNYLLIVLISAINILLALIMLPIFLIFGILASLFQGAPVADSIYNPPQIHPTPLAVEKDPLPWVVLLKSIIYWLVLFGAIGVGVVYYFKEHKDTLDWLRQLPFWGSLIKFWNWITNWLGFVNRQVSTAVEAGLDRLRSRRKILTQSPPWRYINLRNLSPRERVQFYYLAMVRRGKECGIPRLRSATPFEYKKTLIQGFSYNQIGEAPVGTNNDRHGELVPDDLAKDVELITDWFVTARYSRNEITDLDAGQVKKIWVRIRKALVHSRRKEDSSWKR